MSINSDMAALEAILFAMGEPVGLDRLAGAIERSPEETQALLEELGARYDRDGAGSVFFVWKIPISLRPEKNITKR